jgi:hypothetical protein
MNANFFGCLFALFYIREQEEEKQLVVSWGIAVVWGIENFMVQRNSQWGDRKLSQTTDTHTGNVMCSWGMLGRHLQSYFKRRLELWEDRVAYEDMPEALFVNTVFSLRFTQWQNQKRMVCQEIKLLILNHLKRIPHSMKTEN